jgi:hypothetical protein
MSIAEAFLGPSCLDWFESTRDDFFLACDSALFVGVRFLSGEGPSWGAAVFEDLEEGFFLEALVAVRETPSVMETPPGRAKTL